MEDYLNKQENDMGPTPPEFRCPGCRKTYVMNEKKENKDGMNEKSSQKWDKMPMDKMRSKIMEGK